MPVVVRQCCLPWLWAIMMVASIASAQSPLGNTPVLQLHRADMPPGAVGQGQLLRGGPLPGYFQPTSIQADGKARVAIWTGDHFQPLAGERPTVGLLLGRVYRLRVTHIAGKPGAELYPTIELVNRLYPPRGLELKFPVPIVLSQEEMEMALQGYFVTRVVYLENPNEALPVRDAKGDQRVFQVGHGEDPLQAADLLGRPMAIIRLGSRIPTPEEINAFGYGAPPYHVLPTPTERTAGSRSAEEIERAIERSARVPRCPLPPSAPLRR